MSLSSKKDLKNTVVALDIGTSYVKTIVAATNASVRQDPSAADQAAKNAAARQEFYVSAVGKSESRGVRKGVVINIDNTIGDIEHSVEQAEELSLSKINHCILGVSGAHLDSVNSNGVVKVQYKDISRKDILRVLEAAQALPLAQHQEILHVVPKGYTVDGQPKVKDPFGISAVRLETDVHVVTGSSNITQSLVRCVNRNGINVQDLVVNSIASALAVTTEEERDQGVCVIDIGSGTADLSIYYDGVIQYSTSLPLGGSLLTKDLAAGLRVGILSAEQLKLQFGLADNSTANTEVASIGNQSNKIVSVNEIADILKMRFAEITELLRLEIQKSGYSRHLTAGVVITGGTANLKGLVPFAENLLALPVRVGYPIGLTGLADFVNAPEFAAAVGIIKHSIYGRRAELNFGKSSVFRDSIQKCAGWLGEHF